MNEVINLEIKQIFADDDFNSRGKFIPMDVVDLAKDIERIGLIQPIIVMPASPEEITKTDCKYKLIAGFRRRYAHVVLKRDTIPAIIHDRMSDADATIMNLSENLNRADLTILQEARAMRRLSTYAFTEDQIAIKIGKSRGWVQIRVMLLQLPDEVQKEVEAGFINQTQIRELYTIYRSSGTEAVYDAVKKLKDAKMQGRKGVIVDPKKTNKDARRQRVRSEIVVMLENLYDITGPGLHTRCLAWCSGEISDNDLFYTVKEWCEKNGKVWTAPA